MKFLYCIFCSCNGVFCRALARIGKAYLKKDDDESALRYLNKSLSEHRTPEISKLILEVSVNVFK